MMQMVTWPGTWFDDYFYPSNGVYDENLNPHRTNIVWMLIDRNYSVNNPLTAGNYKGALLRLHCSAAGKWNPMFVFAYTYYYAEADIA